MSHEEAIKRLRAMRLILQREIAETKHRCFTNGAVAELNEVRADDAALKLAIIQLSKEPPHE